MAVNKDEWQERFEHLPHWRCPTCGKGNLSPMPDKLVIEETGRSQEEHDHPNWEPEWIRQRFAGFMQCSNKACGEVVSISGDAPVSVWEYQDEHEHIQKVTDLYVVKSVFPPPIPIKIPEAVPDDIKEAVSKASGLIWLSSEAAGNQLRQVVELFLTAAGIPATGPKGGYIPTHTRIEQFRKNDAKNGDALLAVKWLGNSSSHPGGLTRGDVLSAFDMIEFVFENIYDDKKPKLQAIIDAINAAKGPVLKGTP